MNFLALLFLRKKKKIKGETCNGAPSNMIPFDEWISQTSSVPDTVFLCKSFIPTKETSSKTLLL